MNAAFFFQLTQRPGRGEHGACGLSWYTWQQNCDWLIGLKASHLKKGYCIFKTLTELTQRHHKAARPPTGTWNRASIYLQVIWVRIVGPPGKRMRNSNTVQTESRKKKESMQSRHHKLLQFFSCHYIQINHEKIKDKKKQVLVFWL